MLQRDTSFMCEVTAYQNGISFLYDYIIFLLSIIASFSLTTTLF